MKKILLYLIILFLVVVSLGIFSEIFLGNSKDEVIYRVEKIEVLKDQKKEIEQIESLMEEKYLEFGEGDFMRFNVYGGKYIFLEGIINSNFLVELEKIYEKFPDIKWVVLTNVPGSADDEINLKAGDFLREKKVNTYVPENGYVASGGTDLFLSGTERVIFKNAKLGVHSWAAGGGLSGETIQGKDIPKDDPQHQSYLDYYEKMGIPTDFYWYTLEAADSDNIHDMSLEEIEKYKLVDEIIE